LRPAIPTHSGLIGALVRLAQALAAVVGVTRGTTVLVDAGITAF